MSIVPEIACDTLIAVARSRCSTGVAIALVGPSVDSSASEGLSRSENGGFNPSTPRRAYSCVRSLNASAGFPSKLWTDSSPLTSRDPFATFRGWQKPAPRPSYLLESARSIFGRCPSSLLAATMIEKFSRRENPPSLKGADGKHCGGKILRRHKALRRGDSSVAPI